MNLPDMSRLSIDPGGPPLPDDIAGATDKYLLKLKTYAQALPYAIEPDSRMQRMLDFILLRITQAAEARDYDPGLLQWDSMFT